MAFNEVEFGELAKQDRINKEREEQQAKKQDEIRQQKEKERI